MSSSPVARRSGEERRRARALGAVGRSRSRPPRCVEAPRRLSRGGHRAVSVFVDTSALYALLDRDDANHRLAAEAWAALLESGEALATSNYVVVETTALVQHRLGMAAVAALTRELLPVVSVEWVSEADHREAAAGLLAAGRREVGLVDAVSFVLDAAPRCGLGVYLRPALRR